MEDFKNLGSGSSAHQVVNGVSPVLAHATNPEVEHDTGVDTGKRLVGFLGGKMLDEVEMTVWCKLESLQSGTPQLSRNDLVKRLIIWRTWRRTGENDKLASMLLNGTGLGKVSPKHIRDVIRVMRKSGVLDGLEGL